MTQEAPGNLPAGERGCTEPGTLPPGPRSAAVVLRFLVRMAILAAFAGIGTLGYARTLESLLAMATLYCVFVSTLRREPPFGPVLTHADEAAAYGLCACLAHWAA